ncbi:MAG: phage scaffolding protein [Ruminiclostridium sp.]|nr:phage scaffolding protein [Ruminiclostridium sp.]
MKRDFLERLLKALNPPKKTIDAIMAANGKDITAAKGKYADYDDIKAQLEAANATMEKFKDYEQTKADVEKYKAELKKSQEESAAKIAAMEQAAKVKDFLTGKKFVNSITRDAIAAKLGEMLKDDKSKGQGIDELFKSIVKDGKNILVDDSKPTPPVVTKMGGGKKSNGDDDAKAREVMGLPPLTSKE